MQPVQPSLSNLLVKAIYRYYSTQSVVSKHPVQTTVCWVIIEYINYIFYNYDLI